MPLASAGPRVLARRATCRPGRSARRRGRRRRPRCPAPGRATRIESRRVGPWSATPRSAGAPAGLWSMAFADDVAQRRARDGPGRTARPSRPGCDGDLDPDDRARDGARRGARTTSWTAAARSTVAGSRLERRGLRAGEVVDARRRHCPARMPPSGRPRGPRESAGTTPSTIAWSCDTRTVAGVARSWAMSLAARRRSISERSRRSAIALNASASSVGLEVVATGRPGRRSRRAPADERRRPRRAADGSAGRRRGGDERDGDDAEQPRRRSGSR